MKNLELTEEKAKQLNHICQFAVNKGVNSLFDINYYQRQNESFDLHYYLHLLDVAMQYDTKKLIDIHGYNICATYNTNEFLKSGGFLRILKIEQREDDIQDYTRRNLKQSIFATKDWWIFFSFTTIITVLVAIITTLSTDKLSQKSLQSTTTQDSLLKSFTRYILHQDSINLSFKNSLKNQQVDTAK